MYVDVAKYNLIREALAKDDREEADIIEIKPKTFALKKVQSEAVLGAVVELLLNDPQIVSGINPLYTIKRITDEDQTPANEVVLYVLVCYAIAVQQKWLRYNSLMNRYYIDLEHKEIVEYIQDTHKTFLH